MYRKTYRWCSVPNCRNTSIASPKKVFINVPSNPGIRKNWLQLAGRPDASQISTKSAIYICEDHFDLPSDMENYTQYRIMGSVKKIRMKPGCVPSKFQSVPSTSAPELPVIKRLKNGVVIPVNEDCSQALVALGDSNSGRAGHGNMSLGAERVKEEPGCMVTEHVCVKKESEWSQAEWAEQGQVLPWLKQEPDEHWLPFDKASALAAPPAPCVCPACRRARRGDHTYASTDPAPDECVKAEPSSSAGEWSELYAEHVVKDELVLGPERVQPAAPRERNARGSRAVSGQAPAVDRPVGRERSARPARGAPPTAAAAARPDSGSEHDIHTTVDYEKDPLCDVCGRRYALKSDLVKHIAVHIHAPASTGQGEESGGDADDELPGFLWSWARLVPRECRVRLERCRAPPPRAGPANTYTCDMCGRSFALKRDLVAHIRVHQEDYPNISKVIHKRNHTSKMPYSCECKKEFTLLSDLWAHIRRHKGEKLYSCDICKKRLTRLYLKGHIRMHTGEKLFSCEVCKRKFNYLSTLKRHRVTKHTVIDESKISTCKNTSEVQKIYFCEVCNNGFISLYALEIHTRTHTGEKPYSCEVCKKRFTQSGDLKSHKFIHTGEKPYKCEICKKRFRKVNDLYRHKLIHSGQKPHLCQTCGMTFRRLYCLTEHIRKHNKKKPYCCEICSELFASACALKSHKQMHPKLKRGRPRKRRDCAGDDMNRKEMNGDREPVLGERGSDHKQTGKEIANDETNSRDAGMKEWNGSDLVSATNI